MVSIPLQEPIPHTSAFSGALLCHHLILYSLDLKNLRDTAALKSPPEFKLSKSVIVNDIWLPLTRNWRVIQMSWLQQNYILRKKGELGIEMKGTRSAEFLVGLLNSRLQVTFQREFETSILQAAERSLHFYSARLCSFVRLWEEKNAEFPSCV